MIQHNRVFAHTASLLMMALITQPLRADYNMGLFAYNHYDYQLAREEFHPAALAGHRDAQYYLGEIFEGGVGVPIDYDQARHWYQKAARQEHAAAQARLAALYINGLGVEHDAGAAFKWYLRSAKNGYPLSQFETGRLYASGQGTAIDKVAAYRWLTTAASYGDPDAMGLRNQLADDMTVKDIYGAKALAREWEAAFEKQRK